MRIIFAGTPEIAVPTLKALLHNGHEVVGVITRTDAPLGRKKVLTPSPVAQAATEAGIPVYKANKLDAAATSWVRDLRAEIGVVVAYGGLLRDDMLAALPLGWINLHFSKLPKWRGAAPVQRALMAGETELGLDVFRLVAELDAGPVLASGVYNAAAGQSATAVLAEMAEAGTAQVLTALEQLQQDAHAGTAQQGEPSYAAKLSRADGKLDFTSSATAVLAHWAGVTAEPGAYATIGADPVKIHEMRIPAAAQAAQRGELGEKLAPGQVELRGTQVLVGSATGNLELLVVQPAGKARMAAADWLRGRGGKAQFDG